MESNFYAASRLAKINLHDEEYARISRFLSETKGNHNAFFDYCLQWKLAPWIYTQINKNGFAPLIDEDVLLKFGEIHEKISIENEARIATASAFLSEFKMQGIDCAILKGNLFIHTVYHDLGYKKMNDFDMLIHPEDWWKVQDIFQSLGYIPLGFGWGGEKGKVARFSHTGLSYLSPDFKCITGTQWGLKSPTSDYKVDYRQLWQMAIPFDFNGIALSQLSAEYNVLHLVLHIGTYKIGIRDCMDIYNVLLADRDFNEDLFVEICAKSKTTDKAWFALNLTNHCSGSVSETLLAKLRPNKKSFIVNRLNSRMEMAKKTGDFQLSYNDFFHDVEMQVFYFSLFPAFHHKVFFYAQLAKTMFWPAKSLALKFSDLPAGASLKERFLARVKAPYFTFMLIGEEIGLFVTVLLFVKMFFDTIFSLVNYILRKDNYFEFLEKKGINADNIKRAVKNIQ